MFPYVLVRRRRNSNASHNMYWLWSDNFPDFFRMKVENQTNFGDLHHIYQIVSNKYPRLCKYPHPISPYCANSQQLKQINHFLNFLSGNFNTCFPQKYIQVRLFEGNLLSGINFGIRFRTSQPLTDPLLCST